MEVVNFCHKKKEKSFKLVEEERVIYEYIGQNIRQNSEKTSTEMHHIDERRRSDRNQTFSSMLTNTYLIEYMFYIIHGVLKIGLDVSKQKDPVMVR